MTKEQNPGPNTYVLPSKISEGPKYGIGARPIQEIKSEVPGPGYYDISNFQAVTKSDPAFSLGSGQRSDLANLKERAYLPGPGKYA